MTEQEFETSQRQGLRRARMRAMVLGSATVIVLISMIYGFTQSAEAQKQSIEASKQRDLGVTVEKMSQEKITALEEQLKICQSEKDK